MRKRQRLVLIIYAFAVFLLGFMYVPYTRYYPNGVKTFAGHHLRPKLLWMLSFEHELWGHITIDAPLIIAEVIVLTAIAIAAFIFLKRE